jgi:hypothetical protein
MFEKFEHSNLEFVSSFDSPRLSFGEAGIRYSGLVHNLWQKVAINNIPLVLIFLPS